MDSSDYFGFNPLPGELLNISTSIRQENFQHSPNISEFSNQLSSSTEHFQIRPSNQFNPFSNEFQTTKINIPSIQQNQNFDLNRYENQQINILPNYQQNNNHIRESIEIYQDTISDINPGDFPTNQNQQETLFTTNMPQNRSPTDIEAHYDQIINYTNNPYPQSVNNILNFGNNQTNQNLEQRPIPSIKFEKSYFNSNEVYSFQEPLIREVESNIINAIPQMNNDYLINQNTQYHNEEEIPSLDELPLASDVLESGVDFKNIEPIPSLNRGTQISEYRSTPEINEIKTYYITEISAIPEIPPISAVPKITPVSAVPKITPVSAVPKITPVSAVPEIPPISAIPEIPPISAIPEIPPISAIPEIPPISAIPEIPPTIENEISQMTQISQIPHVEAIIPPPLSPVSQVVKSPEKIIVKVPKIQKVIVPKIHKVIIPSKSKILITKTNPISTTQEPLSIINPEPFQVKIPSESTITYPVTAPLFGTNTLTTEVNIPSSTTSTLNIPISSNIQIPSSTTNEVPNSIPFQPQTMLQTHIPVESTTLTPPMPMAISTQLSPTLSQTQLPMTKTIIPIQTHIPYNQYTNITNKSLIPSQIQINQITQGLQQTNNFSQMTQNPIPPLYQQGLTVRPQVSSPPQYQYSLRTFNPLRKDILLNQNIMPNRNREYNASTFRHSLNRSPSLDKIREKRNILSPSYINKTYRPRKL